MKQKNSVNSTNSANSVNSTNSVNSADSSNYLIKQKPILIFLLRLAILIFAIFGESIMFYYYGAKLQMVYFTNQTNIMVALLFLVLVVGDIYYIFIKKKKQNYHANRWIEMGVTMFISITFMAYWGLLSWQNFSMNGGTNASQTKLILTNLANFIIHAIVPTLTIFHWILFCPHNKCNYKNSFFFLIYPNIYITYVMLRGALGGPLYGDTYYPYFFVDINVLGTTLFIIVSVICVIFFTLWGMFFVYLNNLLAKKIATKTTTQLAD